jgi:hypothetical protein
VKSTFNRECLQEAEWSLLPAFVNALLDQYQMKQQADRPPERESVVALQVLAGGGTEHAN